MQHGAQKADVALLGDCFGIELAYDFPLYIASVPDETIEQWGVDRETVLEDARTNLWTKSNEDFRQPQPGLLHTLNGVGVCRANGTTAKST